MSSQLEDALEAAFAEYDVEGESRLRHRFDLGRPRHVTVRQGRRYDADLLGLLLLAQANQLATAQSAEDPWSIVAAAGRSVVPLSSWTTTDELNWRIDVWEAVKSTTVRASWLQERGVYRGEAGIFYDALRTRALAASGVAVAVRHNGRDYADDIDEKLAVYYYPHTNRSPAHDRNEVEALKTAGHLHLPVFFISDAPNAERSVELAWVVAADDEAEVFLLEFSESEPGNLDLAEPSTPFTADVPRRRVPARGSRTLRDPEFKFRVLHRYQGRCVVTGVGVPAVLDAAHVIPVEKGGPDDERNGLLLTATLHRALDANLWAIEPKTLELRTRPGGPTLKDLKVCETSLRSDLKQLPHPDALAWRWSSFTDPQAHRRRSGGRRDLAEVLDALT